MGLRKRAAAVKNGTEDYTATETTTDNEETNHPKDTATRSKHDGWHFGFLLVVGLIHVLAVLVFGLGFIFRIQLHRGEECDMTYSMRQFLQVQTTQFKSSSAATNQYKLYKFVDRRDPRYQDILKKSEKGPLEGVDHCDGMSNPRNTTRIVLYIPGHWGSFGQARSVGAHGLQLTRQQDRQSRTVQRALAYNQWSGNAQDEDKFIYEVYSVDFAEQGGALHGEFLRLQSDFVAFVVQQLVTDCNVNSITIVAHSMGGYVARLTPIRHPQTKPLLSNIITLATPHSNPLYAFEKSIRDVHREIQEQHDPKNNNSSTLIVSISGGLRDEMIQPVACQVNTQLHASSLSVLSTELLERGALGMDHRAIVWCHDVLHQVRRTVWALSRSEGKTAQERLLSVETVLRKESFHEDLVKMEARMQIMFGYWKGICMESAMLYNLPIFFALFSVIGGLRCAFPSNTITLLGIPLSAVVAGWVWCDVSKESAVILSLVANVTNLCLAKAIPLGFFKATNAVRLVSICFSGLLVLLLLLGFAGCWFVIGHCSMQHLSCILYIYCVAVGYLSLILMVGLDNDGNGSVNSEGRRKLAFASLLALTIPVQVAGAITLMVWEQRVRKTSWQTLVYTLVPVCFCCLAMSYKKKSTNSLASGNSIWKKIRAVLQAASVLAFCSLGLPRGCGFLVSNLAILILWEEVAIEIVASFIS